MRFSHAAIGALSNRFPWAAMAAASAHGMRMLVNLIIIKMIAVALGPTGLGAIGNLLSVLSIVMVFAGGGIANGITKYVAEYQNRPRQTLHLLETAFALGFSISGLVLAVCIVGAKPIAVALFGVSSLWWLVYLLGVTHFAAFLGSATIAIVNGQRRPQMFAAISISAYLICIPVAFTLIQLLGFTGAAMALMMMAGCTALPSLYLIVRAPVRRVLSLHFHRREVRRLLRFSVMTLSSAITFPISEYLVRDAVTDALGLAQAGIWQASIRLSGAVMGFYTIYLATSYMPRLSATTDQEAAFRLVLNTMIRVGLIFAGIALALHAARGIIVPLLFSETFSPLQPLLGWQLTGDLFRVCAYTIAFFVIARANYKLHIAAELVQYVLYACVSIAIVRGGGDLSDVVRGYTVSFGCYYLIALIWLLLQKRRAR